MGGAEQRSGGASRGKRAEHGEIQEGGRWHLLVVAAAAAMPGAAAVVPVLSLFALTGIWSLVQLGLDLKRQGGRCGGLCSRVWGYRLSLPILPRWVLGTPASMGRGGTQPPLPHVRLRQRQSKACLRRHWSWVCCKGGGCLARAAGVPPCAATAATVEPCKRAARTLRQPVRWADIPETLP